MRMVIKKENSQYYVALYKNKSYVYNITKNTNHMIITSPNN